VNGRGEIINREPFSSNGLACYVELGFWIRSFCRG
jgi:hypothetical protein